MSTQPRILVVGDIILDRYLHCAVKRVNPEAPGVVLSVERTENRLGGAAAVAYLCAGLGCETMLMGVIGNDDEGKEASRLIKDAGVTNRCMLYGSTTVKQRCVVDGQLLHDRLDWDRDCKVTEEQWRAIVSWYDEKEFDCIVVADYGRGAAVNAVPELHRKFPTVPIIVDPARDAEWWERYEGATLIKCNRSEAVSGTMPKGCRDIITLGEDGIWCDGKHIPTEPQQAVDVTGCGDAVSAVLAWQISQGTDIESACRLANKAAGLQVQRLGVQQILPWELNANIKQLDPVEVSRQARNAGKRIVFTNGCFDVLHAGHVETLRRAKAMGDVLIVGLNSDSSVKRLKGDSRPIHNQEQRASVLEALECVDCVTVFDGEPNELVERIRPDVLVKGEEYRDQLVSGAEFAGRVEFVPLVDGLSSTRIIEEVAQ